MITNGLRVEFGGEKDDHREKWARSGKKCTSGRAAYRESLCSCRCVARSTAALRCRPSRHRGYSTTAGKPACSPCCCNMLTKRSCDGHEVNKVVFMLPLRVAIEIALAHIVIRIVSFVSYCIVCMSSPLFFVVVKPNANVTRSNHS